MEFKIGDKFINELGLVLEIVGYGRPFFGVRTYNIMNSISGNTMTDIFPSTLSGLITCHRLKHIGDELIGKHIKKLKLTNEL